MSSKPKNILNVSDWLYIGSAVSATSGVGIALLKLAGKVPFTKPFGISVLSALALGVLAKIYKDKQVDITPMFETIKTFTFGTALGEGSTFTYKDKTYYIAPTEGDGACGAHAVLGTKENGYSKYAFREKNLDVRDVYKKNLVEKMNNPALQAKWQEWMIHFVKDFLSPHAGIYSKMVFTDELVHDLRNQLDRLEKQKEELKQAQNTLFDQALQNETCRSKIEAILKEEMEHPLIHEKLRASLNEVIDALVDEPLSLLINDNLNAQIKLDGLRDQAFKEFVEKEEVLATYIDGISTSDYYFSTQEVGLMAYLFEKRVKVFYQHPNGTVDISLEEGDPQHPPVEVFHQGIHFSRCVPQELPQQIKK